VIFVYGVLALVAATTVLFSILVMKLGQARRASQKPNCYRCGGTALHVSSPKGLSDMLLSKWDCIPYRCEVCSCRQYRLTQPHATDE